MRHVIQVIFFVVLLLCNKNIFSQTPFDSIPQSIILTDSLYNSEISLEEDEYRVNLDSLTLLANSGLLDTTLMPAAKLYNYSWCNQFVNPYKLSMTSMPDTVCIDMSQYCHPINQVVTSNFGFRRGWRFHYGIDLRLKVGDSLHCSFDGVVRVSKRVKSYGNYIVVRHFNGLETVYGHLSKPLVKLNQVVRAGEVIALGGNTGRSTGPHLHYEVRYLGQPIPPREVIDFENYVALNNTLNLCSQYFSYAKELEQVRYYVVRKGDTLSRIAQKTGVSISQICQLNKLKKTSTLRIGQKLRCT